MVGYSCCWIPLQIPRTADGSVAERATCWGEEAVSIVAWSQGAVYLRSTGFRYKCAMCDMRRPGSGWAVGGRRVKGWRLVTCLRQDPPWTFCRRSASLFARKRRQHHDGQGRPLSSMQAWSSAVGCLSGGPGRVTDGPSGGYGRRKLPSADSKGYMLAGWNTTDAIVCHLHRRRGVRRRSLKDGRCVAGNTEGEMN